jgi:hypothetical protein
MSASESQRVPLAVGVVGHRNPEPACIPFLRNQVAAVLDELQKSYPHTPLILLSSLAEGADQIASEVAIEKNIRVVAPLPFPPAVYRNTTSFSSKEARENFDKLLASSSLEWFVVKNDVASQFSSATSPPLEAVRHAAYETAGEFVVRRSQLLIALWDGKSNGGVGGTAAMVQRKLSGDFSTNGGNSEEFADVAALGPVLHIQTSRSEAEVTDHNTGVLWLWPKGTALAGEPTEQHEEFIQGIIFRRNCATLDEFNRALAEEKKSYDSDEILRQQFGDRCGHSSVFLQRVAFIRDAAARFSRNASANLRRGLIMVFAMIFLAATFFHIYSHLSHDRLWLALFLLSLLGAWATVRNLRSREMRSLDYRMIAEVLRVQCQWHHAGLSQDIGKHYLHQFRGEVAWIRQLLQTLDLPPQDPGTNFMRLPEDEKMNCLRKVRKHWVAGQCRFFEQRFEEYHRWNKLLRGTGIILAILGWVVAAILFLPFENHGLFVGVVFVSGILVVSGGLLLAYAERRLLEELARQYARMHDIFSTANQRLEKILADKQISRAQALLVELGRESLTENASWLMLRRARPLEMLIH